MTTYTVIGIVTDKGEVTSLALYDHSSCSQVYRSLSSVKLMLKQSVLKFTNIKKDGDKIGFISGDASRYPIIDNNSGIRTNKKAVILGLKNGQYSILDENGFSSNLDTKDMLELIKDDMVANDVAIKRKYDLDNTSNSVKNKIMKAQASRGADFDSGNIFYRVKNFIPILVPLFISAFRRADELAEAMESRCYRGGGGRTRMRQMRLGMSDFYMSFVMLLVGIGIVYFHL
jgi:hypothetical protein